MKPIKITSWNIKDGCLVGIVDGKAHKSTKIKSFKESVVITEDSQYELGDK